MGKGSESHCQTGLGDSAPRKSHALTEPPVLPVSPPEMPAPRPAAVRSMDRRQMHNADKGVLAFLTSPRPVPDLPTRSAPWNYLASHGDFYGT